LKGKGEKGWKVKRWLVEGKEVKGEVIEVEMDGPKKVVCEFEEERKERSVYIRSIPLGAVVYVDGEYKGTTPLWVKLEVGRYYEVELEKEGYEKVKERIYVEEGVGVLSKDFILGRKEEKRVIYIHSTPSGAKVYVDGEYKGLTPLTIVLEPGKYYDIEVKKEGYEKAEKKIYVEEGKEPLTVNLTLEKKEKRVIYIHSTPSGARVYVDGEYKGLTPLELELEAGKYHDIEVRKEGYIGDSMKIYVEKEEEPLRINFILAAEM